MKKKNVPTSMASNLGGASLLTPDSPDTQVAVAPTVMLLRVRALVRCYETRVLWEGNWGLASGEWHLGHNRGGCQHLVLSTR